MTAIKHPSAQNVEKAKESGLLKRSFAILGPGLITGAADDDPSGISTYSVAGAAYGYATLWIALLTFPLMVAVQLVCARLGIVTGARTGSRRQDLLSTLGALGSLLDSRRRQRHQHRC
jgi:Mn2+/Fe2+ NRAMP family transporter